MAVFRVERTQNYTIMSNYHLRDKSISLKAKGLLSQMLSLPEDWDYTLTGLAKINQEGKDAIRAAVVELERENPTTEYPAAGGTAAEKSTQIIKERRKKEQQRTDSRKKESLPIPSTPFPGTMDAKGRKRSRERPVDHQEMDAYRSLIRENIRYEDFVQERPWDVGQLDEMVELMVETVCSNRENVRVCGNDLPQAVVKSRLLKLDGSHIRYVFECLKDNTTHIRNIRQYLLTALYNAPATMENYYAAQVNHDLYGVAA